MLRNGHLGTSGKNLTLSFDPATWIAYKMGRFHCRMTFSAFIWCSWAHISCDLVTFTFDLLISMVSYILLFMANARTHFEYPTIIHSW